MHHRRALPTWFAGQILHPAVPLGRELAPAHHFVGFLRVIDAAPDPASITTRIRTFDSADLEQRVSEVG